MDIERMYKFIVMEHINSPLNKNESLDESNSLRVINDSCGDNLFIHIDFVDNKVKDCKWNGSGCSLSMAVSSIMSNWIIGDDINLVEKKMQEYEKLVLGENFDDSLNFEELLVMQNQLPARYKCATLFRQGVDAVIKNWKDNNAN